MQYRDSEIRYDSDDENSDMTIARQETDGQLYRRKRWVRAKRKRPSKSSAASPGCGIAARRQRRFIW